MTMNDAMKQLAVNLRHEAEQARAMAQSHRSRAQGLEGEAKAYQEWAVNNDAFADAKERAAQMLEEQYAG